MTHRSDIPLLAAGFLIGATLGFLSDNAFGQYPEIRWRTTLVIGLMGMTIAAIGRECLERRQHRRRKSNSQCPSCGYDLRDTEDQCPECGGQP